MGRSIEMIRGTSASFEIAITNEAGQPYALQSGEKLLFGVKKQHSDVDYVFLKTITTGTDGVYLVNLTPEDTINTEPGAYVYDAGVQSGKDFYNVIESSRFEILPSVTRWGDAQ